MVVERSRNITATSLAGIGMILVGMVAIVSAGLGVSVAGATKPNPEHKVTLCHRTASRSNPYVTISPDVASVLHAQGHDGHNGPIYSDALAKNVKWGDIIPPFDYGPGEQYTGQNWTSEGQALFDNDCNGPNESTTTSSSTTTSTVPGDTTTSTATTSTTVPGDNGTTTTTTSEPGNLTESTTTTSEPPVGGQGGPNGPGVVVPGGIDATAGSGNLPLTGSPVVMLLGIGLALVASGVGLVARRRHWAR